MQTTLTIKGTHCNSCKALIEDVCTEVKGMKSCTVDFQTGKTVIEHDKNTDWQAFKKEVESLGKYSVELPKANSVVCPECGMQYREHEWAKKCEAWCREHKSCNLEIIKHAINTSAL